MSAQQLTVHKTVIRNRWGWLKIKGLPKRWTNIPEHSVEPPVKAGEPCVIDDVEYRNPQQCHACGEWVEAGDGDGMALPVTCLACYEDMEDPDQVFGAGRHCYPI